MLFTKKNTKPADATRLITLQNAVDDAQISLENAVKKVIIKQGVISLYPDGSDKKAAQKELDKAKHSLLCCIGAYDARVQELKDYLYKQCSGRVIAYTSHAIIEDTYEKFYKKA